MAGDTTARVGGDWHGEPAEVRGRLGRYELRHVLGSGGMGVVFEAIDPELDRAIAVKILHAGSGGVDGDGAERLRREGQAMARLTHPNVIRVYDVGVAHGRMFVAMELIRGVTLADWIAQADRPAEEVIATYVQAGRGLAAAHAAGLVHRDFKPQNVLVGDDGRVLVTDFGLARSIEVGGPGPGGADLAAGDPTTAQPGVIEGTPAFMAPEQRSGGAVDARADQFSFSISLLRALAGAPSPDSWTASTIAQGAPFAPIVVEPGALGRVPARIRGALLRGLELAPERRFASMDELLAQLAPPPPPRPRSWPAWLAAGVVAAAVLGVLAWSAVDRGGAGAPADACAVAVDRVAPIWNDEARAAVQAAFRATGRSYADASFEAVARQLDARLAAWEHARRDNCEDTRLRREQSDAMMDLRAACLQRRLDDVTAFVAELRTADASTVDSAVTSAAAIGDVTACDDGVALARRAALPAEPAARAAIAQLERELSAARASVAAGRLKPGLALAEAAVARAREVGYVPLVAAALALAGEAHTLLEQGAPARERYEEAALAAEAGGDDQLRFECEAALVRILGYQLELDGEATAHAQRAEALLQRLGPDRRRTALLARNRATADWWAGRYQAGVERVQQAIDLYEQLESGADLAKTLHLRAILESELQNPDGSLATAARAREVAEASVGARHVIVGSILLSAGGTQRRLGRYDEALATLQLALAIFDEVDGPVSMRGTLVLQELATVHLDQGKYDDAVAMLRRGLAVLEQLMGPEHSRTALMSERLGAALSKAGHPDEAERALRRAIAIHTARLGRDSPATAVSVHQLAKHFDRIGDHVRAREALLEAVRAFDASQGPNSPGTAKPLSLLGDTELALGHRAAAIAAYQRAMRAMSDDDPFRPEVERKLAAARR